MVITEFVFPIADTNEIAFEKITLSARDEHNEHLFEPGENFCVDVDDDDYRFFSTVEDAMEHVRHYIEEAAAAVQKAL